MDSSAFSRGYPIRPAIVISGLVLTAVMLWVLMVGVNTLITRIFSHHSKPSIQLVDPRPACKICHCRKVLCHRNCGEENMCNLKCEGLCQK